MFLSLQNYLERITAGVSFAMKTRIRFHLETFDFKERAEMGGFCHVKIR